MDILSGSSTETTDQSSVDPAQRPPISLAAAADRRNFAGYMAN
jgi:hypothetical protein